MKNLKIAVISFFVGGVAYGGDCSPAPLTTYINGGSLYTCTENGGGLTVDFNNTILPSYVGLNLLGSNNSAADPSTINVAPGNPGLEFDSSDFTETSGLLSSQAELVHFFLNGGSNDITQTNLYLNSVATSANGLGTGLAIGQELVCVGGTFTSLPGGLVTSVANGVLGTGEFGCNGTVLVGTVADSSGPLSVLAGLIGLPDLTGVTDQADIQLAPYNATELDIIKLQALVSVTGGSASDTGFGNSYTLSSASTPEPNSAMLFLGAGLVAISFTPKWLRKKAVVPRAGTAGD